MKFIYLTIASLYCAFGLHAQAFNFELTGNPVNTTGWTTAPQSSVNADIFVLTSNIGNQTGHVYYSTPQNLTTCSQFTVTFEFRITNSSIPTADGIAFFYITNPPTAFTAGAGIGLPNNPDGLILVLDTYNNGGPNANPKVSLRRLDGTANYTEGSTTGQLQADLLSQTFVTDGNWHTCTLIYNFGTVTVAFDGNPPVMTGTTTLGLTGYFGFSAGTGASWAQHQIKNVQISGAPEPAPPVALDVNYCQGDNTVALTATGDILHWYTSATGGTALPGAPVPPTNVAGTFNWYVSQEIQGCTTQSTRDTVTVTVYPKPNPPVIQVPNYCSNQQPLPLTITSGSNVLWYEDSVGGIGNTQIPVVNTDTAQTITWYATQTSGDGCESDRVPVNITIHQSPIVDFNYSLGLSCVSDTVHFNNLTTHAEKYQWQMGTGAMDTTHSPSYVYPNQGTYIVRLKASNKFCTDSVAKVIELNHPLIAANTSNRDTICEGSTVQFTNTSTVNVVNNIQPKYYWDFGDNATSTNMNPSHTYNVPGVYLVRMIVENGVPCRDTFFRTITVDSLPSIIAVPDQLEICQGDKINFEALLTGNGLNYFLWNFGDNTDLTRTTNIDITHAYELDGNMTVTLQAHFRACPELSFTKDVRIKPLPVINLGADTAICFNDQFLTISDELNKNNPLASWRWNTGATTSSIKVVHHGKYQATVTIETCSATDEIEVSKGCNMDIPNSFTPNGDGVNDYFFPRKLLSNNVVGFSMKIFNRWGQLIFETNAADGRGWDGNFNGKAQPAGVYIYEILGVLQNGSTERYNGNVTLLR